MVRFVFKDKAVQIKPDVEYKPNFNELHFSLNLAMLLKLFHVDINQSFISDSTFDQAQRNNRVLA